MSERQIISCATLAVALFFSACVRGRSRDDVICCVLAVLVSWALCIWSYTPIAPANLLYKATGVKVMPRQIWALQDALLSTWLLGAWISRRHLTVKIVGTTFAVQLIFHFLRGVNAIDSARYMDALDALYFLQLAAIIAEGSGHVGEHIRNWAVRHRWLWMGMGTQSLNRTLLGGRLQSD